MDVAETCHLLKYEEHHKNTHHEGGTSSNDQEMEDEDEHDPRGHGGIGCQ